MTEKLMHHNGIASVQETNFTAREVCMTVGPKQSTGLTMFPTILKYLAWCKDEMYKVTAPSR